MKAYKKIILILALSCFSTDLYKACASGDDTAVSGGALRIIQRFENFSPSVYDDSAGNPTIGYGHLITADEDYTDVELSEDEARTLLVTDMREKSNISDYLTVDLEYYQRDALISLCFNIGIGNFSKSTLL